MSFLRSKSRSPSAGPAVTAAAAAPEVAPPATTEAAAAAAGGNGNGKTAAVVGSGISGLATAWLLQQNGWKVTLYESEPTAGGHSLTDDSAGFPVDLGFQVFNMTTYPHLVALFERLRVETEPSDMSFSLSLDGGAGLEWASHGLPGLFVQKSNALSPRFLNMIREVVRFGKEAPEVLVPGSPFGDGAFGDYLKAKKYSDFFVKNYVLPMCAAVWSVPQERVLSFPARMLVRFWVNHHLLDLFQRPVWRVVTGRSRKYVEKIVSELGDVRLGTPVRKVIPATEGPAAASATSTAKKSTSSSSSTTTSRARPTVVATDGERSFDAVVLATHSDTSLKLLRRGLLHCGISDDDGGAASPSAREGKEESNKNPCSDVMRALSMIPYDSNAVYLHTDASLMPRSREAWASWNCLQSSSSSAATSTANGAAAAAAAAAAENSAAAAAVDPASAPVCVTYWLNRLQRLPENAPDVFVTLNPPRPPCARKTLRILDLDHPVFGPDTPRAQALLRESQGGGGIFFAGAWCGYGFHEDGMASAVSAVRAMGGDLPWDEFLAGRGGESQGSSSSSSMVLPPRVPSPKLSALDRLAIATFDKFARSAVTSGRLTVILPNGEQLDYGGKKSSEEVSSKDPLTAPLTRPGEEWRGAPLRRATLRVVDAAFFRKVIMRHDTGLGEAYMAGDFEVDDLGALMAILAGNAGRVEERRGALGPLNALGDRLLAAAHAARANTRAGSRKNIEAHYDAGNDMYRLFLDETMTYSSALHAPGRSLKDAQLAKLDALLDAAGPLRPGDDVLEIGCGWGSLALRALERFPFINSWTGLTLSKQQLEEAGSRVRARGAKGGAGKIRLLLCDYRDCPGPPPPAADDSPPPKKALYDAVLSCEMVEAVGHEHLPDYFSSIASRLRTGGRAVLQAISVPDARYDAYRASSDFIREHIFPGGHLVSMGAMASAARPFGLAVSAAVDVGPEYACTLREWREAWERPAAKKELIAKLGYPASFWRKYRFYFAYCEAGFDARYILNYQVAFTKLAEGEQEEARGGVGVGENALVAAARKAAAASSSSSSSSSSTSLSPAAPLLLLALLSWVGGALAAAAALLPGSSSFANIAPLRAVAALASLAAAAASALAARRITTSSRGSAAGAAAARTTQLLAPPASLAPIRINGKAAMGGGAAASTAELVAAEE